MDLEHQAIERLRYGAEISVQYYSAPLLLTYSGGKDSEVLLALALRAGIDFEVQHNHTTADAPETVRHVRERFAALESEGITCQINRPRYKGKPTSMWSLIPIKMMPPTRIARYCCAILKEQSGANRCIAHGVRWAESPRRKLNRGIYEADRGHIFNDDNDETRREFETCPMKGKTTINPIVDWTDADVWSYIRSEHLPVNPLYCCGFSRVGCIGCPMGGGKNMNFEFIRYPKYAELYKLAFARMLEARRASGKSADACGWTDADSVFAWWMRDPAFYGQVSIEEAESGPTPEEERGEEE